jgi:hypothetical protein
MSSGEPKIPALHVSGSCINQGPPIDFLSVGTDFGIARRGKDLRFAGTVLRLSRGALRERPADIMTPKAPDAWLTRMPTQPPSLV